MLQILRSQLRSVILIANLTVRLPIPLRMSQRSIDRSLSILVPIHSLNSSPIIVFIKPPQIKYSRFSFTNIRCVCFYLFLACISSIGQAQWSSPSIVVDSNGAQGRLSVAVSRHAALALATPLGQSGTPYGTMHLYLSFDHGQSFSRHDLSPPSAPEYEFRGVQVAFDTSNTIWLLWGWGVLIGGFPPPGNQGLHLVLTKTSDSGATFQTLFDIKPGTSDIAQHMFIDSRNLIHFTRDTLIPTTQLDEERLVYSIFDPHTGQRFDRSVLDVHRPAFLYDASFALDGDSLVHFVCTIDSVHSGSGESFAVKYARYDVQADSLHGFSDIDTVSGNQQILAHVFTDAWKRVFIAYLVGGPGDQKFVATISMDHGQTFDPPRPLYNANPDAFEVRNSAVYAIFSDTAGIHYLEQDLAFSGIDSAFFPQGSWPSFGLGPRGGKYLTYILNSTTVYLVSKDAILDRVSERMVVISSSTFTIGAAPNPFNNSTRFYLEMPERENVELQMFDPLGRQLDRKELGSRGPGRVIIAYDASILASGVHFVRFVAGHRSAVIKLLSIK